MVILFERIQKALQSKPLPLFLQSNYLTKQFESKTTMHTKDFHEIEELYSLKPPFTLIEVILTINTYIATIIKLVALGILLSIKNKSKNVHASNMLQLKSSDIRSFFNAVENGDFFRQHGLENITNDIKEFSGILHFWDEPIERWLNGCIEVLLTYSFDSQNQNRQIEDLFRDLYQKMMTPALKRELGEVFTPAWLAEFLIEDIGFKGDLSEQILDPACGSGTFLLEIIKKIRKFSGEKEKALNISSFKSRVIGLDRNPLAVLAARVNYLWAIADLLQPKLSFTIPVFIADSINIKGISSEPLINFHEYFDFIIGNPPWINWEYLPEESKKRLMELWDVYGLFPSKGWKGKLGYAKYDISAVFVYACMDYYLKEGGKLEFLVTQALIRGIPGRGFRRFEIKKNSPEEESYQLGLKKVHDLTQFQPFEDISTQTAIIQLVKGEQTVYPVPYIEWEIIEHIPSNKSWSEVKNKFRLLSRIISPIKKDDPLSRPLIGDSEAQIKYLQQNIFSSSDYEAKEGANTEGLNCAFWIQQLERGKDNLIHFQQMLKGVKKKLLVKTPKSIEPDLIFPLIRSGDLRRWRFEPKIFIIFTAKYDNLIANEVKFQARYPNTYSYFNSNFKKELLNRKSFAKKSAQHPFYILYGTEDMKSPIKVCWMRMGVRVDAAVVTTYDHPILGKKPAIPQETIIYVPVETLDEAHYLCAILNSELFTKLISMFALKGGKGFASTNILEHINIPKFSLNENIHQELARLSRIAHDEIQKGLQMKPTEEKINRLVERLFFGNQIFKLTSKIT